MQRVHLTTDGQITYCEGISSGSAPVKSYSPLLANALKLTINQLVMTPPFLLFTLAYIQFCLTLDTSKTMTSVKRTFAVALLTNWKVGRLADCLFSAHMWHCCIMISFNCTLGLDCCSGCQLPACTSSVSSAIRQLGVLVVEYLPQLGNADLS